MAGVGHILTKNHDARITLHLVFEAEIDQVGHGPLLRIRGLHRRPGQVFAGGVQVFGIHMPLDGTYLRQCGAQNPFGRAAHLLVDLLFQTVDRRRIENAFAQQAHLQLRQRVESSIPLALRFRPVEQLVIGKRMGIQADDVAVDKGRPLAGTAVLDRPGEGGIAFDRIGAIHLGKIEVREISHQARDVSPRRVHVHRHGDGVAVVFHNKHDRQPQGWRPN